VLRIYNHEVIIYDSLGHSNISHVSKIKEWLSHRSAQHWKEIEAASDVCKIYVRALHKLNQIICILAWSPQAREWI